MERTIARDITASTTLCLSLSGRPGNTGTRFHNHLYDQLGLDFVNKAFTTTDITAAIAGVRGLGIRGVGVSMPWKEDVVELVDELDRSAEAIGSVNTVVNTDGHLKGYNTDYVAISKLLTRLPAGAGFAVIGAGGMAKAMVAAFRDAGFTDGVVVARNPDAGGQLAERYGYTWLPALGEVRPAVVVNCTPIGMEGGPDAASMPVADEVVQAAQVLFDVVPRPVRTPMIQRAEELRRMVITGAEVMSLQAAEQFTLYTGVRPTAEQLRAATEFSRRTD